MKLLFDQNLAPHLVSRLADLFPDSNHVYALGLDAAADIEVWEFARQNGFIIVTKDADFSELSALRGFPPKLIWLRLGNCTSAQIESLLRLHHAAVQALHDDPAIGLLSVS